RPRAGLLRTREFVMKDSYSFDVDDAGPAGAGERPGGELLELGPGEDLVAVVDGTPSGDQYSITAVFPPIPPRAVAPTSESGVAGRE
ncbi:MAG: hypothetical protein EBY44_09860, partial [Actinobacteria bacterium]|nr:hypothetical protein [Actinomycetota bacterium]